MQHIVHYFLHFIFPIGIAYIFYKDQWKKVSVLFWATMLVDLDHILAEPIYAVNRCSIGFHPLHSFYAIGIYVLLLFFKNEVRIIGLGLVMHMITDGVDCLFMSLR